MVKIKIYRGTHSIGGCVTEISTDRTRIIIDFGSEIAGCASGKTLDIDGVTCGKPDCGGVFITHYHGDHVGEFSRILPQTPIYMGNTAKKIFVCVQNALKNKLGTGDPERTQTFSTFTAGQAIKINDITLTPYCVDHSAFDSYMFLIEAEGKRILHTGDFRMHGARGRAMPFVFYKYCRNIDVMITEGTMLGRLSEKVISEHELGRKAKHIMRYNKNVFVLCSSTNIDTFAEFYGAAATLKRPFIICEDDFQGEILRAVTQNSKSPFYNFARRKVYTYGENLNGLMSDRGFCFMGRANYVTEKAMRAFPQNVLVYSMWGGYIDQSNSAYDSYKGDFTDRAVRAGSFVEILHTSGHATADDLRKACDITGARVVFPVHTEYPERFSQLGIKAKIAVLNDGEEYSV